MQLPLDNTGVFKKQRDFQYATDLFSLPPPVSHPSKLLQQVCVSSNADGLTFWAVDENLDADGVPIPTYFPELVEGNLTLSLPADSNSASTSSASASSGTGVSGGGGVVWNVSASEESSMMIEWVVFPSEGLLLPGER